MSTPATYKIYHETLSNDFFFYVPGDNSPERTAVRFKNMLNNYNATSQDSLADSFSLTEREACFRDSHEQDDDTVYRYALERTQKGLVLTAERVKRSKDDKKITTFFKGRVQDFIQQYAPPLSFATGIYKIDDEGLRDNVWFYTERGNDPMGAAYRLGLMNGFYRGSFKTYAASFSRTNEDTEIHEDTSYESYGSDYLYILEPLKKDSEEEEVVKEVFVLKAYRNSYHRQLFFEGSLEDFIKAFGKS